MSDVKTAPTNTPRAKTPAPVKPPANRRSEPAGNGPDQTGGAKGSQSGTTAGETAEQSAASQAARIMSELKVSGHLMALEQGLYCITHAPAAGSDGGNLPGVRISTPPQPPGALDRIAIASFRPDGFLHASGDAALVRVLAPAAQVLVTIYQSGATDSTAPNIQVRRLLEPAAPPAAARGAGEGSAKVAAAPATGAQASAQTAARPGTVMEMVAHIQERADVGGMLGEWLGERGSKRWIEGFGVMPHGLSPSDVEYQAVLGRGWLSPWVEGGQFCGSRGMALPVLGFRIRLRDHVAETHEVVYSATFIDGSEIGPVTDGAPCESDSLAAMEAFHIVVRPRGQAAVDAAEQDSEDEPAAAKASPGKSALAAAAAPKGKKGRKG